MVSMKFGVRPKYAVEFSVMLTLANLSFRISVRYVVVAFASSHFSLVNRANVPVSGFRAV